MAASVDTSSPIHLKKEPASLISSSPLFSPSSDQRFWSNFRTRIDSLLEENQKRGDNTNYRGPGRAKSLKEDSLLLLRGFDSVADSLSQLSNNIANALQGANDLAKHPTLTEIFQSNLINPESKQEQEDPEKKESQEDGKNILKRKFIPDDCSEKQDDQEKKESQEDGKNILKRKFNPDDCSEKQDDRDSLKVENKQDIVDGNLKRAKNLAVSMATKAASLARELKSVKSEICFMEERYALVEEENRRLRDGFITKGIRPEEDDLVRLQLEALLAEKSRLASENANLIRENQCLNQLVEYHQVTTQDLSASYEQVIHGLCLDFSSPPRTVSEGEKEAHQTPETDIVSPLND